jgi:catechol 2,3-dioxygenase-like lactoylglutathione lyase family enzyme
MISGIYENCIGTNEAESILRYWKELGYHEVKRGTLSAGQAHQLYGHDSPLLSIRLQNGDSEDHGNIRVFQWQYLKNQGLEFARPLDLGSRWFASMAKDIYQVRDAFADDQETEGGWVYSEPARDIISTGNLASNFYERFVGVREFFVLGKDSRHAFFQRYGYTRPGYGNIHPDTPLGVSEGTHSSFVTGDHHLINFYAEVLGLTLVGTKETGDKTATRQTLQMNETDGKFLLSAFLSPKTHVGLFQIYSPLYPAPDLREQSQPGSRGISLFTYRVEDINDYHARVVNSQAESVSAIISNEFGESSFGFKAPDGMYWVIVGE